MTDEELRLECLRLSNGDVELAQQQFAWVRGQATDKAPRMFENDD